MNASPTSSGWVSYFSISCKNILQQKQINSGLHKEEKKKQQKGEKPSKKRVKRTK